MNRSDILFVGTILIHLSLLLPATACLRYRLFKPAVYCLVIYTIISVYTDCVVAAIKLDRLLGLGGTVRQHVASLANITFVLDAVARIAVLIGISLSIVALSRLNRSIHKTKRVG